MTTRCVLVMDFLGEINVSLDRALAASGYVYVVVLAYLA